MSLGLEHVVPDDTLPTVHVCLSDTDEWDPTAPRTPL